MCRSISRFWAGEFCPPTSRQGGSDWLVAWDKPSSPNHQPPIKPLKLRPHGRIITWRRHGYRLCSWPRMVMRKFELSSWRPKNPKQIPIFGCHDAGRGREGHSNIFMCWYPCTWTTTYTNIRISAPALPHTYIHTYIHRQSDRLTGFSRPSGLVGFASSRRILLIYACAPRSYRLSKPLVGRLAYAWWCSWHIGKCIIIWNR